MMSTESLSIPKFEIDIYCPPSGPKKKFISFKDHIWMILDRMKFEGEYVGDYQPFLDEVGCTDRTLRREIKSWEEDRNFKINRHFWNRSRNPPNAEEYKKHFLKNYEAIIRIPIEEKERRTYGFPRIKRYLLHKVGCPHLQPPVSDHAYEPWVCGRNGMKLPGIDPRKHCVGCVHGDYKDYRGKDLHLRGTKDLSYKQMRKMKQLRKKKKYIGVTTKRIINGIIMKFLFIEYYDEIVRVQRGESRRYSVYRIAGYVKRLINCKNLKIPGSVRFNWECRRTGEKVSLDPRDMCFNCPYPSPSCSIPIKAEKLRSNSHYKNNDDFIKWYYAHPDYKNWSPVEDPSLWDHELKEIDHLSESFLELQNEMKDILEECESDIQQYEGLRTDFEEILESPDMIINRLIMERINPGGVVHG